LPRSRYVGRRLSWFFKLCALLSFSAIIGFALTWPTISSGLISQLPDHRSPTVRPSDLRNNKSLKNQTARDRLFDLHDRQLLNSSIDEPQPGVFSLQQKLIQAAGDGIVDDQFAEAVAVSGNTAVVGAYNANISSNADQGAVYVFVRSGASWSLQQKLVAADGVAGDGFGVSVAVQGDTLLVGAYAADKGLEPSEADRGAAYIFTRAGTTWSQQQKLTPSDGTGGDIFGFSVSLNNDSAIIGAPLKDVAGADQGAAYVFTRSAGTWAEQQRLTSSDGAEDDAFGVSVSNESDTAVIGALRHDVGTNGNQGAVYVFTRSGVTWAQQQELTAGDGGPNDQFGVSIGLSGNSIVVGANFKDNGPNLGQGAAYVFTGNGAGWSQQQKLIAADGTTGAAFGASVGISQETVAVGASDDDAGAADTGSVYTFARSGATWTQQQKLNANDAAAGDSFGAYVGIEAGTMIVGAPLANITVNPDQGAAYIFFNPAAGPLISINDLSIMEGNSGSTQANFTVTLSDTSAQTVTVQYATADGTATAGNDYVAASGMLTFTAGQTSQPISITINPDSLEEPNESFMVNLTNATNSTIGDGQGIGTINNDDIRAALPAGFVETQISGLSNPTAMAIHPDGRIFVCEQGGSLRVIKNGALLATPFLTLTVSSVGERGLLGVAFDPNFATNNFVYVYYTATTPAIHNRVSRFTASGDVAVPGSEVAVLDLNNLSGATNHNGGAIHFGPDGKLYVAVGENANGANAQSFGNLLGKMLRINTDPLNVIPTDNPYFNEAAVTGLNKAIWSLGLRNPFTFGFQPGTGKLFINDVGENAWEEINLGVAHSNYGWNLCEGPSCGSPPTDYRGPIYVYNHSTGTPTGCAIVGGAFYNPTNVQFPAEFLGKYFFADLCSGFIRYVDPVAGPPIPSSTGFATGISNPVDLQVADDGSLYYLARGTSSVFRVQYTGASTLAINDVSVSEGNSGTTSANFTVTLSPASSQTVIVQYATANGTALAGSDYVTTSGALTFTPGETSKLVSVTVNGDMTIEPNETFFVNLSNASNATITDNQGVATILNDDLPAISINDVAVTEGNSGTTNASFNVSLNSSSSQTITVNYATANGTATAGSDYAGASGMLTFTPGQTTQMVNVAVNGDTTIEPNETFFVNLSNPTNATIADSQGVGTINNDDVPAIAINDVQMTEGNSGTTNASFTVSLNAASLQTVTVNYATANDTAAAGSDYQTVSGPVTFMPGQITQTVNVPIIGDSTVEPNETFFVNLTLPTNATIADAQGVGTIINDDSQPQQPTLSINDIALLEGNGGTTAATFTVSLSPISSQTVTVQYATASGTALAGSDFTSASGTLTFAPGDSLKSLTIGVTGETAVEPDETFVINLSNATNAIIGDTQGQATIVNDDSAAPTIQFSQSNFDQPESNQSLLITVRRTGDTSSPVTVDFRTVSDLSFIECSVVNGQANQRCDYLLTTGTLTFGAGEIEKTFTVVTFDDSYVEGNETFTLNLSNPTGGAVLGVINSATVTIVDNDAAPPTSNPIDGSRFFVRQQYSDFLQRVPDQGGEDFWTGQIDGLCAPTDASCINRRRVEVSAAFFVSSEFSRSGGFVYRLYKAAFGEQALYRPLYAQFSPDRARVVDGADIEQGKLSFANLFVQRSEFISRYPLTLTATQFVDAVLLTVQQGAGVTFTANERQSFINDVGTGGRGLMMKHLGDNTVFSDAVFNRAFVLMQYFGYLRRDPDQGGYDFWLSILNSSSQNFTGMVCAFITSPEYQQRFSAIVTRTDSSCQ